MVGEPEGRRLLIEKVAAIYEWIEARIHCDPGHAGRCRVCGVCCDFPAYDHRLFVTPPELIYLAVRLGTPQLKEMPSGRCPYQQGTACTIHKNRFASCRIFCCDGDPDFQSELSEQALRQFKDLCEESKLPYRYQDLPTALAAFNCDTCQSAAGPSPADRAG